MPQIQKATTTDNQYQKTLASLNRSPEAVGILLNWVWHNNIEYLDLSKHRFELNPV